jgi:hypothetical protein
MDDSTAYLPTSDPAPSDDAPEEEIPTVTRPEPEGSGVDRKLAAEAYKKALAGEELTVREQAVLKRYEKDKEERLRWKYYQSIPQKHWREMSGRQTKVINEQALRYGIPFGGATINLPSVARALHDFLADNAVKLAKDDDELMQGNGSPALERYREERAAIARLDRLEREGLLVPRDEIRQVLGRVATILRGAGDALQRQFGPMALEILYEALDDAEREIDRSFGESDIPEPKGVEDSEPDDQELLQPVEPAGAS